LADKLKPFGVSSRQIRLDAKTTVKGYRHSDLAEAFSRYLPECFRHQEMFPHPKGNNETSLQIMEITHVLGLR